MKRAIITTIQILVSVGLILWIFHDPNQRAQMADALRTADLWWFLPGLLAVGLLLGLQALRWQLLLRAIGIRLHFLLTARIYMIGAFFNLFILGATGGDVVKIYYAMREAGREKAAAFLSVVVDRVIGLLALALVSAVVLAMRFQDYMSSPIAKAILLTTGAVLGGAVGIVAVGALVAILKLERHLPERMPMHRAIVDLAVAIQRYAKSPGTLLAALALSIAGHLLIFSSFYFAARAFTSSLSLDHVFTVMPGVSTITSIPISFGGVGLREQVFQNLFHDLYGVPNATAALVSMSGYLMTVAWSLIGGVLFMTFRSSGGASLREMSVAADEAATEAAQNE